VKLIAAATLALASLGGWLVLRDSGLFAVEDVTIVGLSSHAEPQVARDLLAAARSQTTTDFSVGDVRAAVSAYTLVTGVTATTHFPHSVTLHISERLPVARLEVGGDAVPVTADGSVVSGYSTSARLPTVRASQAPLGGRTQDPFALVALRVLEAAPAPLFRRVASVTRPGGTLTIYLHHGPRLIFGDGALPHAKWAAVAAVLSARSSRGAAYIDVVLPSRPAAQVGDAATSAGAGHGSGAPASATTSLGAATLQLSSST
jgi:cell division protein FtsQ